MPDYWVKHLRQREELYSIYEVDKNIQQPNISLVTQYLTFNKAYKLVDLMSDKNHGIT